MKAWQWFAVALILVCILVGSLFGYRSFSKRRDLAETLAWMEQTYNPHEGGANWGRGYGHETHYQLNTHEVTEDFAETFSYSGCNVVLHNKTNPVGAYKTVYSQGDKTLNLSDVDSDTIKVTTFGEDAAEVEFHIRNDAPKISENRVQTFAELTGTDHEQRSQELHLSSVPMDRSFT